ncbi:MAG: type I-C CRISPR-associated protein Cas5c [Clostridiales bacterium]
MEFYNKEFCLEVWGDYACFTRPEMKVERVSYDVITPSAARAVFEAIFWKPAIRWKVKKIEVLNPIKWISVRRNEIGAVMRLNKKGLFIEDNKNRQQKAGLFLKEVRYRLYAELEFINPKDRKSVMHITSKELIDPKEEMMLLKDENPGKYNAIFERRAQKGQCFNQPYLGCREFSAAFKFVGEAETNLALPIAESRDLGFMLYDMDFTNEDDPLAMFYRPKLENGIIIVPPVDSEEVYK